MSKSLDTPPAKPVLEVEQAGSTLLDMLVSLGHLDEQMLNQVNDLLLDARAPDGSVSLQLVRRVAAQVIFEREDQLNPESRRAIDAEWGLLFH